MRNPVLASTAGATLIVMVLTSGGARTPKGGEEGAGQDVERPGQNEGSRPTSALGTVADFLGTPPTSRADALFEARQLRAIAEGQGYSLLSMVAIVPDPIRAHNGATFDLAIVGIQKAAGYAGLQLDRHWFPWTPSEAGTGTQADAGAKGAAKRNEDAAEAGVVLFRGPPASPPDKGATSRDRGKLLIVLLVGESPIIGVSAPQLEHALSAAAGFGSTDDGGRVAFLGPFSSGAAVSIGRYVPGWWHEASRNLRGSWRLRFVSGTATGGAVSRLLGTQLQEDARARGATSVTGADSPTLASRFTATVLPDVVAGTRFLSFAAETLGWRPNEETAVLFEVDSAYGRAFADAARVRMVLPLPSQVAAVRNEWDKASGLEDRTPTPGLSTPRTFLNLNLGDRTRPADVIPETATLTTTVNDFAIGASLEQLERAGIRQVGVFLTDVRDKLYLIRLLRQRMPGLVLFTSEAHMLLAHPAGSGYLDGLLTYSSYPLRPGTQASASAMRVSFSSAAEQGIFNAFCTLLGEAAGTPEKKRNLIDYYEDGATPGRLAPALWISVVSKGRFTPVAMLRTPVTERTGTTRAKEVDWIEVVHSQGRQINTGPSWGYGGSWVFVAFLSFLLLGPGLFLLLLHRQVLLDQGLGGVRRRGERSRLLSIAGLGFASGAASGATLGLLAACGLSAEGGPSWFPGALPTSLLVGSAAVLAAAAALVRRRGGIRLGSRATFSLDGLGVIALLIGLAVGAKLTFGADPDGLRTLRYLSGLPERSPIPSLGLLLIAAEGFGLCQLARETVKLAFLGLSPRGSGPDATAGGSTKTRKPADSPTFSNAHSALTKLDGELRNSWSPRRSLWVLALACTILALATALGGRLFLDVAIGRKEVSFVFLFSLAGLGAVMAVSFVRFQSTWRSVDRFCRRVETTRDEWDALQRVTSEEVQRRPAKGDGGRNEPDWSPLRAFSVFRPPSQRTVVRTAAALRDLAWPDGPPGRLENAVATLDAQVVTLAEHSGGPWLGREAVRAAARANDEAADVLDALVKSEPPPERARDLLAVREIAHISAAFRLMRNDVLLLISGTFLSFLGILLFPFEPKTLTLRVFGALATFVAIVVLSTFASMNRSALLSLLSGSNAGDAEVFSREYVKKAATFLTVPALSLLATTFPEVWQPLGKVLWPLVTGVGK